MATWNFKPLTTSSNAGSLAAYPFNSQGTQHVIYIDNNDLQVHELWCAGDGIWQPNDLTNASGALDSSNAYTLAAYVFDLGEIRSLGGGLPPVLIPSPASTQHVDYIDANNDVHELWWQDNEWFDNDLSKAANVSLPGAVLASGYVFYSQGTQHVICRGAEGHVHELWWDSNGWHPNDLTVDAGALLYPLPIPGHLGTVGCAFDSQGSQHVFYTGSEGNVHELLWDTTGWHHNYLTTNGLSRGPSQGPLAAYVSNAQGTLQVIYIDNSDSHVHLLWCSGNGIWNPVDLTQESQAPVVWNGVGGLTGYATAEGTQHVAYMGDDNDVHELSWDGNSQPVDNDLTTLAHVDPNMPAPSSLGASMVGYAVDAQGTRHVIYIGQDGNIYELWWG
jgi:hypothetical protein